MRVREASRDFSRNHAGLFVSFAGLICVSSGVLIAILSPREWFSFAVAEGLLFTTTITVLVLNSRFSKDAFTPLTLTAVFYLLAFGAGGIYYWFSPGPYEFRYESADLTEAVLLANVGWLFLLAGYLVNPFRPVRQLLPQFPRTPSSASVFWTIGPLLAVGWSARLVLALEGRYFLYSPTREFVPTGSSWLISTAALLPILATAFVGARSFVTSDATQARFQRRLYWVMIAIEVAWHLPTGGRSNLIGLALMSAIVSYYGRGRQLPWRSIVLVGMLLAFTIFPLALKYRENTAAYRTNTRLALSEAVDKTYGRGLDGILGSGATSTFSRFSDVTSLALIASRERIPLGGSPTTTLLWIPETFVPRAILPTKANPGLIGNEFATTYGLSTSGFQGTSIAMSQVGELYLNFGLLGLVIGMPLIGGFYRLIGDYFEARGRDVAILAVYAVTAWQFVNGQETIIAVGLVGVFKLMLVFALMISLATAIQRRWAPSGPPVRLRETAA